MKKRSRSADSNASGKGDRSKSKAGSSSEFSVHSAGSTAIKNRNYTGGSNYSGGKTADANGNRINQINQTVKAKDVVVDEKTTKYARNESIEYKVGKHVKHKGLRRTLEEAHERIIESASRTAATEVLLSNRTGFIETEHDGEKTYRLKQNAIKPMIDLNTQRKCLDLSLTAFGPYMMNYSRNGRSMLLCGEKGHVASIDLSKMRIGMEMQLQEAVYDVRYLHNEQLFACAQNKYTYIYDDKGMEIHCLKGHERPYRLDFLPYHLLLTTIGHSGWIKWQDISTGEYVAGYQTGHGPSRVLRHNPTNAVSHVGHSNGVVSLWSPASGKALVTMFTHKSPVTDLTVDREGKYMTTAGLDGLVKIWDLRTYKVLHSFRADAPVTTLDTSDTGLLALGLGREVQVLKDAFLKPTDMTYIKHTVHAAGAKAAAAGGGSAVTAQVRGLASSIHVQCVKFRPYEDILGCTHSHGLTSIVVPGSGEANFDTFEANPFANTKQTREAEVQSLLYKLRPEMIGLDAKFVGTVDKDQETLRQEHQAVFNLANDQCTEGTSKKGEPKEKHKMRGRNKISAKLRRKQKNVLDAQTVKLREMQAKAARERAIALEIHRGGDGSIARGSVADKAGSVTALRRFGSPNGKRGV